jgi:hypothetical protein
MISLDYLYHKFYVNVFIQNIVEKCMVINKKEELIF